MNEKQPQIITSAQMRAMEATAIGTGSVTGLELMERAGTGLVTAILAAWPELARPGTAPRAVILCGPGNNGGDGFVVARQLRKRGWRVALYLYGGAEHLPPDARANHDRWCKIGRVNPLPAKPDFGTPDLIVDALFGIGLSRPLTGFDTIFAAISRTQAPVLSVDLPSGRDADARPDTMDWPTAPTSLVVTFHALKPAHAHLRARGVPVIVVPLGL
ncbi:NAD(P)H-hydrate epimerase [Rhodobacter sp. JA431]|uniref:NAD(P)H-hydrate epimerase n=1 Tax=Rhodobacter sp. JA431 TaxID=570013 RepID=UPI000BDC31E4|nr:NAD(P)H-hydrate epimerase [Rhodobacter sp. JA431]